ncbi:hypothetical protein [Actinoplanes sp. NPDC051859]|uniref:hypothetical protein n=1 Tax=Actinoplanes sp. NPDC051859 TaxID=3363909 RepID=UPI00378CCB2C
MTLRFIGGEMAGWSDPAPAGGATYRCLVRALHPLLTAGSRVLVAGPHQPELIAALPAAADVTCLIRGDRDAKALPPDRSNVLCGSVAELTDSFDVIIALDGVARLCTVEGPQYRWTESLQVLRRLIRPGGVLLLAVENELGVHRLVDRRPATSAPQDADWHPLGDYDTKPSSPARLREHLAAAGLTASWLSTAWPLPATPTVLVAEPALRTDAADPAGTTGALAATVSAATGAAFAGLPVLSDPRRLAAAAVRGGIGPELAPALVVLAFHGPAQTVTLPTVLVGDGPPAALPPGRMLEELLIGACLRHDLPTIRRLLSEWTTRQPAATADNVLVDGDAFAVLDPTRPELTPEAAVRRFAATLLEGGYEHPWPATDDLAAILLAAAGLDPAPSGGPAPVPHSLRENGDPLPVPHSLREKGDPLPVPHSLREQGERLRRLEVQLADSTAQLRQVEAELTERDGELRRARLQIDLFRDRASYRLVTFGVRAARKAFRTLRHR